MAVTLDDLNAWPRVRFIGLIAGIFEHSLWVAERVEPGRPFADLDALHAALVDALAAAPRDEQIALLRAQPGLLNDESPNHALLESALREAYAIARQRLDALVMEA